MLSSNIIQFLSIVIFFNFIAIRTLKKKLNLLCEYVSKLEKKVDVQAHDIIKKSGNLYE